MEVDLVPEATFTVKANGKSVPGMRLISEWEGLKKLQDTRGRVLIVASKEGPFANMFRGFLGDGATTCCVVMASPDLVAELTMEESPNV